MQYGRRLRPLKSACCKLICVFGLAFPVSAHAADAGFTSFIVALWPEARDAGVSRATFDAVTAGLEPDYKLPDLALPGRPATGAPSQAEFVQVPADYIKEASIARLAVEGQRLLQKHRATLSAIEKQFGVPATVILAIWGRETDYGRYALPYDGIRVLATQAYVGRRKEQYRGEFIAALKLIENGDVTRKDLRASWGGATGLTQFLPSELAKHGVDFDGDGHVNIWTSIPDALASAAQQLVHKGWQPGLHWAYGIDGPSQGHYYVDFQSGKLTKSKSSYEHPQPHACFIQSVADDLVNEGGIMDLWVREARLFKYGSGAGSQFS